MIRKGIALLLTLAAVMTLWGSASAEEAKQEIKTCEVLTNAFTLLEEGNPFIERYNRIAGENVQARMKQGVPYFWGGRAESHLFAKEPDYIVQDAWQSSPAYYRAGVKYIYGFDCVGFVAWVWKQVYGTSMPKTGSLFNDREHQIRNRQTGEGPLWDGCAETLVPGDILLIDHDGRHIAIYAGTLRMYGYTAEEVPELAEMLDIPLVIHCTTNAQVADRFADLIANGLPKYKCATVTDGGVCVSLMVQDRNRVPGLVHQQNQDTRYYTLPDGTWLTVLACDDVTDYCWLRYEKQE